MIYSKAVFPAASYFFALADNKRAVVIIRLDNDGYTEIKKVLPNRFEDYSEFSIAKSCTKKEFMKASLTASKRLREDFMNEICQIVVHDPGTPKRGAS